MKDLMIFVFALISFMANAQDVIVKKDGSTILSKVLEVNPSDIKYKKFSNQNGPTYTIDKSEVMSINYENGEKDVFTLSDNTSQTNSNTISQYVPSKPSFENDELIRKYSTIYQPKKKSKGNSTAKVCFAFMNVKKSSILSNDEIEVSFVPRTYASYTCNCDFTIMIKNKTNHVIYVDLGNTFAIELDGRNRVYYDTKVTQISNGASSGVGVNLGGVANVLGIGGTIGALAGSVNVGGGKNSSVTTTYAKQRVLMIPPNGMTPLSSCDNHDHIILSKSESVLPPNRNHLKGNKDLSVEKVKIGTEVVFTEEDSPYSRDYIITYSSNEFFSTFSTIQFGLYISEYIGFHRPISYPQSTHRQFKNKIGFDLPKNILVGMYNIN